MPGDLPDSGIKPTSPALTGRFFPTEPQVAGTWEGACSLYLYLKNQGFFFFFFCQLNLKKERKREAAEMPAASRFE